MTLDNTAWTKVRQPEGFFSVHPLPSAAELSAYYARQYYQNAESRSYQAEYSQQEVAYKKLNARLFLHAIGASSQDGFLEVGCGEGFLLEEARLADWPVTGVDFSSYGIERFHPDLRDQMLIGDAFSILDDLAGKDRRFGACVLQNVLEHVIDPRQLLSSMLKLTAPGGKLLVTVPNDYSRIQEEALKTGAIESEYWFVPPQHLHYFTIESASALARACGFSVADVFCDFPIETFLFHPGSNYVRSRDNGRAAHEARMGISLLSAEKGLDAYLALSRAYADCGIGRAFTLVLTPGAA